MKKKQFNKNTSKCQGGNKGKRSFKNDDVHSEGRTNGDKLSSLNDIAWYKRYPELLEASARIAFPYRPGMSMNMGHIMFKADQITAKAAYDVPGVAALKWIPSFGRSAAATDPTSIAAREIYSKVRSKYSGSLDADAPDFLMYMGALDSIFSYIGALKRIYRILDIYTPQNYVLPDGLLRMMGLSNNAIAQLRSDKANFNLVINELIRMTKKFAMPASMDLFVRHYWMNDNVYTDRADINSQFYVFTQAGFYQYEPQDTPGGVKASGLILVEAPWGGLQPWEPTAIGAVRQLFDFGTSMINKLSAWDDCYTISGYLMRAYEGVTQFTVDELPLHEEFSPVFVPEVLSQIENSVGLLPGNMQTIENIQGTAVSQDPATNAVIYKPQVLRSVVVQEGIDTTSIGNWINLHENNPSSEAIVIATRLHPVIQTNTADSTRVDIYAGTEIPMGWNVMISSLANGKVVREDWAVPQHFNLSRSADAWNVTDNWVKDLTAISALAAFDYHPLSNLIIAYHDPTNTGCVSYMHGDVSNLTMVPDDVMFNIHRVCTFSELNAFTE